MWLQVAWLLSITTLLAGELSVEDEVIKVLGQSSYSYPRPYWMLFFNDRKTFPNLVPVQASGGLKPPKPYIHLIIGDFSVTTSSRKMFVLALLEIYRNVGSFASGYFYAYIVPVSSLI